MGKITVKNIEINVTGIGDDDFISLTDIAKIKIPEFPREVVKNWMRLRSTIEFIGIWELLNNENFNKVEFDPVKRRRYGIQSIRRSNQKDSLGQQHDSARIRGGVGIYP